MSQPQVVVAQGVPVGAGQQQRTSTTTTTTTTMMGQAMPMAVAQPVAYPGQQQPMMAQPYPGQAYPVQQQMMAQPYPMVQAYPAQQPTQMQQPPTVILHNNGSIGAGDVPPNAPPGGTWGYENYIGMCTLAAFLILIFVFWPVSFVVFCCPCDGRQVYFAPNGRRYTRSGAMCPPNDCCGHSCGGPDY